jgi:hypothetical protein
MSDKKDKTCEPPFWQDVTILFQNFSLEYKPTCQHSAWNFGVRLLILSLFVGLIASVFGGLPAILVTILFGFLTALVIIITTDNKAKQNGAYQGLPYIVNVDPDHYLAAMKGEPAQKQKQGIVMKEGFANGGAMPGSTQPHDPTGFTEVDAFPYSGPALPDYTPPTARNLFMNVLLEEIKYNPGRPAAAPVDNPTVKQTLDDYFRVQWFSDPTDVFGKNQSQRQFVTQPSTTVPNDQGSFADWLYKIPGKTCKEGGREACLAGTDGGPVPWLNMAS